MSTNFAKTLVWKQDYDVILWRHKQRTPNTNDYPMPLNETPPLGGPWPTGGQQAVFGGPWHHFAYATGWAMAHWWATGGFWWAMAPFRILVCLNSLRDGEKHLSWTWNIADDAMALNRFLSSFPSFCLFQIAKHIRRDFVCTIVSSDTRIEQYAT